MSGPVLQQYNDAVSSSGGIAFLSNVTEGDMLVVLTPNGASPSDSLGNTYSIFMEGVAGGTVITVAVCLSSKASGACTVSISGGASPILIAEFSPSVFQGTSGFANGGSSATFAGAANQLLVGLCEALLTATITGVGVGFTQEAINDPTKISLEYQALAGSGNVGSVFTTSGSTANIGTCGFTLSSTPTPLSGTPSIVQSNNAGDLNNNVTAGDSLFVIAYGTTNVSGSLGISDTLNNSWTLVMSNAVATGSGGDFAYNLVSVWFCPSSAAGSETISVTIPGLGSSPQVHIAELSPCSVAASSGVASGSLSSSEIASSSIAAQAGQLLVSFGFTLNGGSASGSLGVPCGGFQRLQRNGSTNQSAFQPVVSSGNYGSAFNTVPAGGASFAGPYQTGAVALVSAEAIYSISGNAGLAGATVSWTGTSSGSTTADGSGNFSITGLTVGSYTVTPSAAGYTFSPPGASETITGSNITGVNFTATQTTTYSISGHAGIANAIVSYSGAGSGQVVADADGSYSILDLLNGAYTITPSKTGFVFSPTSRNETISGADTPNVNFTAVLTGATPNTVIQGVFRGSSFMAAFPQNSVRKFDLMQIKNRSGAVVWKLDATGVVTVNPTTSTDGTLLGTYSGANWAAAFISSNQNPMQSDLIQIQNEGGDCIWRLDYTGTVYTF